MSVYGSLVVNESSSEEQVLQEKRDPERVSLIVKINGSIGKTLTNLGLKASVKEHKFTHDVSKFANNKKESFKVDITLDALSQSVLKNIINALPIPTVVKMILFSLIDGFTGNQTLEAIKIITAAEDDIKKNLKKDIPEHDLKVVSIEKDKRYTNAVLMTISL